MYNPQKDKIKPLYRKRDRVNDRRAYRPKYSWQRHIKKNQANTLEELDNLPQHTPIKKRRKYIICFGDESFDYTPLYKYLLTQVGQKWKKVVKYIRPRLNDMAPVESMVLNPNGNIDIAKLRWNLNPRTVGKIPAIFDIDEDTWFSTLYVDKEGILQFVNPKSKDFVKYPTYGSEWGSSYNGHSFKMEKNVDYIFKHTNQQKLEDSLDADITELNL